MSRTTVGFHETNRRRWNSMSAWWQERVDRAGVWQRCAKRPSLVLTGEELRLIGRIRGKRVCVLGSGDNKVVFALAGMGARVTSVDISEAQLATAATRADSLGLHVRFVRADVTRLPRRLPGQPFDLVYTGGHVAVWVSDLWKFYAQAARILRPGGRLIVSEYHPFRRPWKEDPKRRYRGLVVERSYLDHRPQRYGKGAGQRSVEFMWTVSDYFNAIIDGGIRVDHFSESGDRAEDWEPPVRGLPELLLLSGTTLPRRLASSRSPAVHR